MDIPDNVASALIDLAESLLELDKAKAEARNTVKLRQTYRETLVASDSWERLYEKFELARKDSLEKYSQWREASSRDQLF
jgi:predicted phage-related endonuclease